MTLCYLRFRLRNINECLCFNNSFDRSFFIELMEKEFEDGFELVDMFERDI